MGAVKRSPCSR